MHAADEGIARNFAVFQDLLQTSESFLTQGEWQAAAAYAQIAAHHAWGHHCGIFASPRLERNLLQIGERLGPFATKDREEKHDQAPPRSVLHVLTRAYGGGGHTRLVWRWISLDADHRHSVALTGQGVNPIPAALRDAVQNAGGKVHLLDGRPGGLLSRARALRLLAAEADHIVLHIHPYDVVPIMAFSQPQGRPPITLLNHADHVFWLGVSIADQVAHFREAGSALSQMRRGVPKHKCVLLPLPLPAEAHPLTKIEARRRLGLPEKSEVLLSVAAAYKYTPLNGLHFVDALLPVLQEHPNAVLLVVGPDERGRWAEGVRQAQGMIKVLGPRHDIEVFYAAADIYLDSFPFGSFTAVIEAGSYGAPVVSYCHRPPEPPVLCCDDPALPEALVRTAEAGEFRQAIACLLENRELRLRRGELTRNSILAVHQGPGWVRYLQNVYAGIGRSPEGPAGQEESDASSAGELDVLINGLSMSAGVSRGLPFILREHIGLLPFIVRSSLWRKMLGLGWPSFAASLVSDWTRTRLLLLGQGRLTR